MIGAAVAGSFQPQSRHVDDAIDKMFVGCGTHSCAPRGSHDLAVALAMLKGIARASTSSRDVGRGGREGRMDAGRDGGMGEGMNLGGAAGILWNFKKMNKLRFSHFRLTDFRREIGQSAETTFFF